LDAEADGQEEAQMGEGGGKGCKNENKKSLHKSDTSYIID
jgi:hypothetical protein